jgi:glutamyl-Q tRNA(Asp) synthetase
MKAALRVAKERLGSEALAFTETGKAEAGIVQGHPERWGDAVIVRKDVPTSYHLAVVVDDAWQGITHVTRGIDLLPATDLHRLLQVLLGLPAPVYHHHRLIADEQGRKLSKSARDTSLRSLREAGATPADVERAIGFARP